MGGSDRLRFVTTTRLRVSMLPAGLKRMSLESSKIPPPIGDFVLPGQAAHAQKLEPVDAGFGPAVEDEMIAGLFDRDDAVGRHLREQLAHLGRTSRRRSGSSGRAALLPLVRRGSGTLSEVASTLKRIGRPS